MSSRISAQAPQFPDGPGEAAITYFVNSSTPQVFKSKDALVSFLTELDDIGGEPVTFSAQGIRDVTDGPGGLADWMTNESRGFDTFQLRSGHFSLGTGESGPRRGRGRFYLHGTIRLSASSTVSEFEFPQLVAALDNATRLATGKERRAEKYPYVTYQSREAIDATKSNRNNLIAVAVVSVVGTFIATVALGVLTNVLHF